MVVLVAGTITNAIYSIGLGRPVNYLVYSSTYYGIGTYMYYLY